MLKQMEFVRNAISFKRALCLAFQYYSINVQVIGNHKRLLYNVSARYPGKAHDARVWTHSEAKKWTEKQTDFLIAGMCACLVN